MENAAEVAPESLSAEQQEGIESLLESSFQVAFRNGNEVSSTVTRSPFWETTTTSRLSRSSPQCAITSKR